MANPVDHDGFTSVATAGVETGKGVIKAFSTVVIGAALIGGLLIGGIGLIAGAVGAASVATGFWASVGAAITGGVAQGAVAGLWGAGIGGLVGIGGAIAGWAPITAIGAAFGLHKGGSRIEKEIQAYQNKGHNKAQQINDAAQAGYAMGVQHGQQQVVSQLQQMQYAAIQQQMEGAANSSSFADKFAKPAASKADMVEQERAAQMAAQPAR
jgi:hypothetical protein